MNQCAGSGTDDLWHEAPVHSGCSCFLAAAPAIIVLYVRPCVPSSLSLFFFHSSFFHSSFSLLLSFIFLYFHSQIRVHAHPACYMHILRAICTARTALSLGRTEQIRLIIRLCIHPTLKREAIISSSCASRSLGWLRSHVLGWA